MNKHYLDIDYKNMCFYEYSKEPKDGFEKYTNGAGKESYRKLYKGGVFGLLQSVSVVDTKHQGKKLVFRLLHEDDIYLAGFSLYDQKGQYDNRFIEPIIPMLANLKKEQAYRIFPWSMESETAKRKDGSPRVNYGVSIKLADLDSLKAIEGDEAKIVPVYVRRKKEETFDESKHLPDLEFVEELGSYRPTAVSVDNRRNFLTGLLTEALKELGYEGDSDQSTSASQEAPQQAYKEQKPEPVKATVATASDVAAPAEDLEEDDYDDLPF